MPGAIARERMTTALQAELEPLILAHWQEVAAFPDIPLAVWWEKYHEMEASGALRMFIARDGAGALVGYLCMIVVRSLHYAGIRMAQSDALFVQRSARGAAMGVALIRHAAAVLRAEGVTVLTIHSKHREPINIGPLLQRAGLVRLDDIWALRLDRE